MQSPPIEPARLRVPWVGAGFAFSGAVAYLAYQWLTEDVRDSWFHRLTCHTTHWRSSYGHVVNYTGIDNRRHMGHQCITCLHISHPGAVAPLLGECRRRLWLEDTLGFDENGNPTH